MKRPIVLLVSCVLLLFFLPACDVLAALKVTPTPPPTPTPTPTLAPTPEPNETVIKFKDPAVEKLARTLLSKPEGDVTVGEMRTIKIFDYNPSVYEFAKGDIRSLEDLRYCDNLEYLYIVGCKVTDLSPLAGLDTLQSVWIVGNPVTDASCVLAMPSLRDFYAFQTGVTDLSALSGKHNLRSFSCSNKFKDYAPLLAQKDLAEVSIAEIDDDFFKTLLGNCSGLTGIGVRDSKIKGESLALLDGRKLDFLDLENCGLDDISALAGLSAVKSLLLNGNFIADISPLKKVQIGYNLDLRDNLISDWSPLEGMTGLKNLQVTGNPVTHCEALTKLKQSGCSVID